MACNESEMRTGDSQDNMKLNEKLELNVGQFTLREVEEGDKDEYRKNSTCICAMACISIKINPITYLKWDKTTKTTNIFHVNNYNKFLL